MKNFASNTAGLVTILLLGTGCARLMVTKLDTNCPNSDAEGVRYSLPKPYLQVTPQTDGSIVADIIYLPDPENTYVIDANPIWPRIF